MTRRFRVTDIVSMTVRTLSILIASLCVGCSPTEAPASRATSDPVPAGSPPVSALAGPVRYQASMPQGGLRLVQTSDNRVILDERAMQSISHTSLRPAIAFVQQPDGADITFTYVNNTGQAQPLGRINFAGIRMDDVVDFWDVRHVAAMVRVDRNHNPTSFAPDYPGDAYSPVMVIQDSRNILGFQIMYPCVQYDLGVRMRFFNNQRWSGDGGPNWAATFELMGSIPAGQTRVFQVAVRCQPKTEHWLKTLLPYRDYFWSLYGRGPTYVRDPRPVTAVVLSQQRDINPDNPRGYSFPNRRPDIHGFRPWAREIVRRQTELGYNRAMVWAMSGQFDRARARNYPANAISPIMDIPAARDSRMEMANVASPTLSVGYYIGYAQKVERWWDIPGPFEDLDPTNPDQLGVAMKEHDMVVELNGTMVGLDAFETTRPYHAYAYLALLRDRYPNIKYIAELSPPDIIHTLAGSFLFDMDVQTPHVLADFLIPGHETWLCAWGQQVTKQLGRKPTINEWKNIYRQYAAMGYTVLDLETVPIDPTMNAAEGWVTNIPAELRAQPPLTPSPPPPAPNWQIGPIIMRDPPPPTGGEGARDPGALSNDSGDWGPLPDANFVRPSSKLVKGRSPQAISTSSATTTSGGGGASTAGFAPTGGGGGAGAPAGGVTSFTAARPAATGGPGGGAPASGTAANSGGVPMPGEPSTTRSRATSDRFTLDSLRAAMTGVRVTMPRAGTMTRTGTLPVFITGQGRVDPTKPQAVPTGQQEVIVMPANTDGPTGKR